jgi:hypothetical protein
MSRLDKQRIYARHIIALFLPGSGAPVHSADSNTPGDLTDWSADDIKTLIDEGRRQLDRQNEDLERVRGRAQVTLALGIGLEGAAGSLRAAVSSVNEPVLWFLWILGLALVAWATLGAAATAVVRVDMEMIHAAVLSRRQANIGKDLAKDYAAMAATGENQIATRLTNLWLAVALLLAGATATFGAWLWADAAQPHHQQSTPQPVHQRQWQPRWDMSTPSFRPPPPTPRCPPSVSRSSPLHWSVAHAARPRWKESKQRCRRHPRSPNTKHPHRDPQATTQPRRKCKHRGH